MLLSGGTSATLCRDEAPATKIKAQPPLFVGTQTGRRKHPELAQAAESEIPPRENSVELQTAPTAQEAAPDQEEAGPFM